MVTFFRLLISLSVGRDILQEHLTVNNIVKALDALADQWIRVADCLSVPGTVVDGILVSRLPNDKASLRRVVEWWFKNSANPEWITIQEILDGN